MTDYQDYVRTQIVVHGQIEKPEHYHIAERVALTAMFMPIPQDVNVLDVGCGTGKGMRFLKDELNFQNVWGIELHPEKAELAGAFHGDIATFEFPVKFDVFYASHSFEHMFDPAAALANMIRHVRDQYARFIFILPYPESGDPKAHCASPIIGTDVDDEGATAIRWFEAQGLRFIWKKLDDFREKEIWLKFEYVEGNHE